MSVCGIEIIKECQSVLENVQKGRGGGGGKRLILKL